MEKVPVCCCENVAENDSTGLVADTFSNLTLLLPFPKHRWIYICICLHAYSLAHMHTRFFLRCCSAFLFASGQIICFPCICVLFGQLAKDADAESGQLPSAKSISMSR